MFRETLETSIIVSVLLVFLKQTLATPSLPESPTTTTVPHNHTAESNPNHTLGRPDKAISHVHTLSQHDEPPSDTHSQPVNLRLYKALRRQILLGTLSGLLLCFIIGGAVIGVFYTLGVDKWESSGAELNWEGSFCLLASLIISVVGAALLRVGRMKDKWMGKMAKVMEGKKKNRGKRDDERAETQDGQGDAEQREMEDTRNRLRWWKKTKQWMERYVMFALPFVTVLREGVEAIVFVAGVSFAAPATSIPIPAIVGVIVGALVGVVLYQ